MKKLNIGDRIIKKNGLEVDIIVTKKNFKTLNLSWKNCQLEREFKKENSENISKLSLN